MEITDVKIRLVEGTRQKVKAFCSITLDDCFVIKDIKVIEGEKGEFIAMPSRKISEKCVACGRKNPIGSSYCSSCGKKQPESQKGTGQASLYSDIAHPINAECRKLMQDTIVAAYRRAYEESIPVAELADEPPPPAPVEPEPVAEEAPRGEGSYSDESGGDVLEDVSHVEPEEEEERPSRNDDGGFGAGIC